MTNHIPLSTSFLPLICTNALASYGLYLSWQNIQRLQTYEAQSEKAAEWSQTAADRLHKTRTTQTSGTLSLLLSYFTPIFVFYTPWGTAPTFLIAASAVNALTLFVARRHMAAFWNEKVQTRIPFVQKFNDAVRGSEQVVTLLGVLSAAWVVVGVVFLGMVVGVI